MSYNLELVILSDLKGVSTSQVFSIFGPECQHIFIVSL